MNINEFRTRINEVNEKAINDLFTLFENEDIFETYSERYNNYFRLIDKNFQNNILLPFIKKVLKNDKMKQVFLEELEQRIKDKNYIGEFVILEILLKSINENEFRVLFKGCSKKFFEILLDLDKKNGDFDFDFWMWEYQECIGESLSHIFKEKIISTIKTQNIGELIDLMYFSRTNLLNKLDAVSLIIDYNLIDFIIKEFVKLGSREKRNKLIDYEFGLNFSEKFENYTNDYIIKRVRKYVKRRDYDEISTLIHLHLLDFLDQEEIKSLFVDYDYTLFIHWKQGDDLARHLEDQKGDAVKALLSWADELESNAEMLERLVDMFKGKKLEVIDAQVHHISLGGDEETLEKAVKEKLLSKDEIDIYYD